ncbi:snaclec alboaggregin-D subunit beta-like [Salmo salar]|uniref:Snaclec alboaggregin-D subunit beta-like n=1 Tax=Salmo salar TaxID=8030 RepID=A0ABM3EDR4_SALSA|nr:snaclec alboaggregin-D subunit beta-like [Salmo salar]
MERDLEETSHQLKGEQSRASQLEMALKGRLKISEESETRASQPEKEMGDMEARLQGEESRASQLLRREIQANVNKVEQWLVQRISFEQLKAELEGKMLPFFCLKLIVVRESKTWEEALEYCREQHTDLTSLVSETELLLAQRESRETQTTTAHLWMGLRYLANHWLWVNGDPVVYEAWPQGGQHQCPAWNLHCGAMATAGAWETRDCQESLNFICY